ncbi:hypothetical protein [uncultured Alistipes sp.]|uniref:hypothetical protein n=1 Tax=uncultured Alistipes sp. TaxID=538949 RepID=UPI00260EE54D|nr:hypothetical protein [uncultured Alistipes sp.]
MRRVETERVGAEEQRRKNGDGKSGGGRAETEEWRWKEWRRKSGDGKSGEGTRSKEKRGRTEVLGIGKKANNIKINT